MSEKVQIWRDEIKSLGEHRKKNTETGGICAWIDSGQKIHFGQLLNGYNYESPIKDCEIIKPSPGKDFVTQSFVIDIQGFFNENNFTDKSIQAGTRGYVCYFGDHIQCRRDFPESEYRSHELEMFSAKNLVQHIDDEVRIAHDLLGSDPITQVYSTENFALRNHSELGNLMGLRLRKETQSLKADGTIYKNLNENSWIWFTWDYATRGNSFKSHISTIAESVEVDSELIFVPPLYGGKYGIMYVYTGEDIPQEEFDWRELNISTMPRDDI